MEDSLESTAQLGDLAEAIGGAVGRQQLLNNELATVRGELARIDTKAGILLSLAGAGLAVVLASGAQATGAERVFLVGAAVALTASALTNLMIALRPKSGPCSFRRWAALSPADALSATVGLEHAATDLVFMSGLIHRKYQALRSGVGLLGLGVVLLAAAAIAAITA